MKKTPLNYKTALLLSFLISLLLNMLFLIMFFYGRDAVMPNDTERVRRTLNMSAMLSHVVSNMLMAFILYIINFWILKRQNLPRPRWLYAVIAVVICTAILSFVFTTIQMQFGPPGNPTKFIRGGLMRDYFVATIVMLSSQLLYIYYKQQQTALENESLQSENIRTRFLALKNQVDPHFLFNSLNTLNSLIKVDADKAQEYVQQLSYVFRYTLQNKEVMTLEDELKFTQAYCRLMQIRYADSLRFVEHIDPHYKAYFVVPLCLQTLVENAIKHNVVSNKQPLVITIATTDNATISVSNPIQPKKEAESSAGIGLANLAERYRLMWKKEITVNKSDEIFEVIIPLMKEV